MKENRMQDEQEQQESRRPPASLSPKMERGMGGGRRRRRRKRLKRLYNSTAKHTQRDRGHRGRKREGRREGARTRKKFINMRDSEIEHEKTRSLMCAFFSAALLASKNQIFPSFSPSLPRGGEDGVEERKGRVERSGLFSPHYPKERQKALGIRR